MLYLIIAAIIVLLDQGLKFWIVSSMEIGGQVALWPGVIHLTYVQNAGAAFSMLTGMRWILLGVTSVCALGILVYLMKTRLGPAGKTSLAFVLGGAIGNIIDRAVQGYVVDMFEVEFMHYAVFNVADCFIVVGGILFCIFFLTFKEDRREGKRGKKTRRAVRAREAAEEYEQQWEEPAPRRERPAPIQPKQPEVPEISDIPDLDDLNVGDTEEWTETKILEEYDLLRWMSEEDE